MCLTSRLQTKSLPFTHHKPVSNLSKICNFAITEVGFGKEGTQLERIQRLRLGQPVHPHGFRVPLIVVSPYPKRGYVSNVTHDFGSILEFIEEDFNLPSLRYADARADDMSDCFDSTQSPPLFQTIPAVLGAAHFLSDGRRSAPPDD
jgi:phospholipase C